MPNSRCHPACAAVCTPTHPRGASLSPFATSTCRYCRFWSAVYFVPLQMHCELVRVLLRRGPSTEAESRPPKHYAGVRNMGPPEFHRTPWPKLPAARNCGGCAFFCRLVRWLLYPRLIVDRARDWIGQIAFPLICSNGLSPTLHPDLCNCRRGRSSRLVDRESGAKVWTLRLSRLQGF
jgi:hypothetical protein